MEHWIDTATHKIVANSLVDSRPRHAEFSPDGAELWVSSEIGGTVTVFEAADQSEKGKIHFEITGIQPEKIQPVGMRFSPDAAKVFVALGPANHIAVVDAKTLKVEKYILVGRRVWHMEVSPDKTRLFTTNGVSGDVTAIDLATLEPIKTIKVGRFPWGAAARPTPN